MTTKPYLPPPWEPGGGANEEVWRAKDSEIDIVGGMFHVPSAMARWLPIPEQHRHAEWVVDVEGSFAKRGFSLDEERFKTRIHMERAFKTRDKAEAFCYFVRWCVEQLTSAQLVELAKELDGRLT